jgi:hypothetical protein
MLFENRSGETPKTGLRTVDLCHLRMNRLDSLQCSPLLAELQDSAICTYALMTNISPGDPIIERNDTETDSMRHTSAGHPSEAGQMPSLCHILKRKISYPNN